MTESAPVRLHATCVALDDGAGAWQGVLLRGPSGAGKSDLALRLIEAGARLVADDLTEIVGNGGIAVARAAADMAGQLEVRGLGIVDVPSCPSAPLRLVCDLVPATDVPRQPEAETVEVAGIPVPRFRLAPFEASAPTKVRLGVGLAVRGILGLPA
jgi:HPr kinase/phosphorylase